MIKEIKKEPDMLDSKKKLIICIDDELITLETLMFICESSRFNVKGFTSPLEGLRFIQENPSKVLLVFLDLMMPEMYGINVLEILKEQEQTKNLPVVINSCLSDPKEVDRAYKIGAKKYINKPFNRNDILSVIRECL